MVSSQWTEMGYTYITQMIIFSHTVNTLDFRKDTHDN